MPLSTYTANKLLDCYLRGVAISPPSRVWLSLHASDPASVGAGEVTLTQWPGYARRDVARGGAITSGFNAASNRATENALLIMFPEHDGPAYVAITHVALWDAPTGGNCLIYGALIEARNIAPGDEIGMRPGDLLCMVL